MWHPESGLTGDGRARRPTTLYRYRFGAVGFDETAEEFRVGGPAIDLQRKPRQILSVPLRHHDKVVTKDELLDAVWPGLSMVEIVIAHAVAKLHAALGEAMAR